MMAHHLYTTQCLASSEHHYITAVEPSADGLRVDIQICVFYIFQNVHLSYWIFRMLVCAFICSTEALSPVKFGNIQQMKLKKKDKIPHLSLRKM